MESSQKWFKKSEIWLLNLFCMPQKKWRFIERKRTEKGELDFRKISKLCACDLRENLYVPHFYSAPIQPYKFKESYAMHVVFFLIKTHKFSNIYSSVNC